MSNYATNEFSTVPHVFSTKVETNYTTGNRGQDDVHTEIKEPSYTLSQHKPPDYSVKQAGTPVLVVENKEPNWIQAQKGSPTVIQGRGPVDPVEEKGKGFVVTELRKSQDYVKEQKGDQTVVSEHGQSTHQGGNSFSAYVQVTKGEDYVQTSS